MKPLKIKYSFAIGEFFLEVFDLQWSVVSLQLEPSVYWDPSLTYDEVKYICIWWFGMFDYLYMYKVWQS